MKKWANFTIKVLAGAFGIDAGYKIGATLSDKPWAKKLGALLGWVATEAVVSIAEKQEAIPQPSHKEMDTYIKEHPEKTVEDFFQEKEKQRHNTARYISR